MEFFDKKEEVIDVKLTRYGRNLLSKGMFRPQYYMFFDDDILYNSQKAGFTESQNSTEVRILEETPKLKTQYTVLPIEEPFESPVPDAARESVTAAMMSDTPTPHFSEMNFEDLVNPGQYNLISEEQRQEQMFNQFQRGGGSMMSSLERVEAQRAAMEDLRERLRSAGYSPGGEPYGERRTRENQDRARREWEEEYGYLFEEQNNQSSQMQQFLIANTGRDDVAAEDVVADNMTEDTRQRLDQLASLASGAGGMARMDPRRDTETETASPLQSAFLGRGIDITSETMKQTSTGLPGGMDLAEPLDGERMVGFLLGGAGISILERTSRARGAVPTGAGASYNLQERALLYPLYNQEIQSKTAPAFDVFSLDTNFSGSVTYQHFTSSGILKNVPQLTMSPQYEIIKDSSALRPPTTITSETHFDLTGDEIIFADNSKLTLRKEEIILDIEEISTFVGSDNFTLEVFEMKKTASGKDILEKLEDINSIRHFFHIKADESINFSGVQHLSKKQRNDKKRFDL